MKIEIRNINVNYQYDNHPSDILNTEQKVLFGLFTDKREYWKFKDGWWEYDFGLIPLSKSKQKKIEKLYQNEQSKQWKDEKNNRDKR